jgi:ferredoxin/flavodoxin
MKALLCYHSQSGNTALACRFLSNKMDFMHWDLFDVVEGTPPDIQIYDVVGFATWTYYLRLPPFFEHFLNNLPDQKGGAAFIFSTFGVMPGRVLMQMEKILTAKGFAVMDGYSLHTPESYPPYIIKGWDNLEAPTPEEMRGFDTFTSRLTAHLLKIQADQVPQPVKIRHDIFSRLIPPPSPRKIRRDTGALVIDAALCDQCGICAQICLYEAIGQEMPPIINFQKCRDCWACFHHCPRQAIFSEKTRGEGYYSSPAPELVGKLGDVSPEHVKRSGE